MLKPHTVLTTTRHLTLQRFPTNVLPRSSGYSIMAGRSTLRLPTPHHNLDDQYHFENSTEYFVALNSIQFLELRKCRMSNPSNFADGQFPPPHSFENECIRAVHQMTVGRALLARVDALRLDQPEENQTVIEAEESTAAYNELVDRVERALESPPRDGQTRGHLQPSPFAVPQSNVMPSISAISPSAVSSQASGPPRGIIFGSIRDVRGQSVKDEHGNGAQKSPEDEHSSEYENEELQRSDSPEYGDVNMSGESTEPATDSDDNESPISVRSPRPRSGKYPRLTYVGDISLTHSLPPGSKKHFFPDWTPVRSPAPQELESQSHASMMGASHNARSQPQNHPVLGHAEGNAWGRFHTLVDMAVATRMAQEGDSKMAFALEGLRKYHPGSKEYANCSNYVATLHLNQSSSARPPSSDDTE
ncbi:hypothetical protein TWF696_008551 [Orbilia brochopaga]|uniref:Uncharacterized protein n=1 Tax=Orbilia brochopaga TaxID=3140254 RepID=A0AAV9ULU5_9PEZI